MHIYIEKIGTNFEWRSTRLITRTFHSRKRSSFHVRCEECSPCVCMRRDTRDIRLQSSFRFVSSSEMLEQHTTNASAARVNRDFLTCKRKRENVRLESSSGNKYLHLIITWYMYPVAEAAWLCRGHAWWSSSRNAHGIRSSSSIIIIIIIITSWSYLVCFANEEVRETVDASTRCNRNN